VPARRIERINVVGIAYLLMLNGQPAMLAEDIVPSLDKGQRVCIKRDALLAVVHAFGSAVRRQC
jgi:hypothetical protein